MRIKKAKEAKHEASLTPATSEWVKKAADASLVQLLRDLKSYTRPWAEPRGDLYHWIDVLNLFDKILEDFVGRYKLADGPQTRSFGRELLTEGVRVDGQSTRGSPEQDLREEEDDEALIIEILTFSLFLLDNCANRSLYSSSEHLSHLLNSTSLTLVTSTLHLGSRLALTYLRSWAHRQANRHGLSLAGLNSTYRIDTEKVQKLTEPFAANLQLTDGGSSLTQTPSKSKESNTPHKKGNKQAPKVHPSDLVAITNPQKPTGDFSEFAWVCFDLQANSRSTEAPSEPPSASQAPATPTPARRVSGPSKLSRSTALDESLAQDSSHSAEPAHHKLVLQPHVVETTDIHELLATNLPKIPSDLHYAFLVRLRYAKAFSGSAESRQLAAAAKILSFANIALLYTETMLQQKFMQQDSTEPKQLQIIHQLAELAKPPANSAIAEYAIEALDALARGHKGKHNEIITALGINVTHGTLFQILRSVVDDLSGDSAVSPRNLRIHETVFVMLDQLLKHDASRTSSRTVESLVSTGLFGVLVEILNIHSNKAQATQNRVVQFVNDGMHSVRDGVRAFANAGGLDAVSELVAWEVNTCLQAIRDGDGLPLRHKSRLMDYEAPYWNQQTLRTTLKLINHMLQHSNPTTDRLLRNLIDTPVLLKAVNEILKNAKLFGSNNYSQAIMLVSTFINNEPTSFSVIAEAGLSKSLLESVGGAAAQTSRPTQLCKLPIKRVPGSDEVVCGLDSEMDTVSIARAGEASLAANVMSSSDVLANLPQTFGAICLNVNGMEAFLSSNALEAYFQVFESRSHVLAFVSEASLADNVGHAFDELVRHHPRLKTAVIYHVILTIARVDYRCRHLLSSGSGAKLAGGAESSGNDESKHSGSANEDTFMSGSIDDVSDTHQSNAAFGGKDPEALDYVGSLCRFLMTFLTNTNMAGTFVEQGGFPFLLDLCSLPTIPHDSIKPHHYNAMHAFSKAVHMCVEAKPHIALPLVVKYTSDVLDQVRPIQDAHQSGAFFKRAILGESDAAQEGTMIVKSLVQLEIVVNLLQEIFSMPVSSRERYPHLLATVNLADMYVDIIRRMGHVNRFCVWELVTLLNEIPETLKSKTAPWVEGYGDEASRVLALQNSMSFTLPTPPTAEASVDSNGASAGEGRSSDETSDTVPVDDSSSAQQYSSNHSKNIKIIRHLMTSLPVTIINFFHNIGEKLVPRRRPDSYQRQNAFMIAETLADVAVAQLKYKPVEGAKETIRNDFLTISVENVKNMLSLESSYDTSALLNGVTIVLPSFRNRGGVAAVLDILKDSLGAAIKGRADDAPSAASQTALDTIDAIIKSVLTVLECLTSSKYITESHQSQVLQNLEPTRPLPFNPAQFLVELRHEILPAVEHVWNEKGSEKLEPASRKKIIRILRTVLEADHEHGAFRKGADVPTPTPVTWNAFKINEEKLKTIKGQGYDVDLATEALYRCTNDRDKAPDYCSLRKTLPLPRFPIPAYDQRREQNPAPPTVATGSAERRDSQSTIPDPDVDDESRADVEARTELSDAQSTNAIGMTAESDADDGRMAMSIDNLLNLSDQGHAASSSPAAATRAAGSGSSRPAADTTSTPIQFVLNEKKVGIDDLDKIRAPLRKELIMRVMDMLTVEDDRLTFDLAELLSTAANKAPSAGAMRETRAEFGDTLIQALVSFNDEDKFNEEQANISAIANLLAILLQEREFYEACVDNLKQFIDQLLDFIRVSHNSSHGETYPWIGQILLIFERLLSEELQPASIVWTPPTKDEDIEISKDPIANYADPIFTDEQRERLFDSLSPVLPHVGKDKSLALSIVRVLVMLTRHRSIADKLAAKVNLQRLFLMIKQLAGLTTDKLQGAFMLILRHISEDEETIRKTMRNVILSTFKLARAPHQLDTTSFVRQHFALVLRAPKIFLEVVNELLKLQNFDADVRPQTLALKPDVVPELFTPWQPPNATGNEKQADEDKKADEPSAEGVVPTTETGEPAESPEKSKTAIKPPTVEHPGGLIHFLLTQLLLYKDTEDQETGTARSQKKDNDGTSDIEMEANENTSDDEPTAPHATVPSRPPAEPKSEDNKKEAYRAEDHPIYQYRCFILQCLTELLMSYNQSKVEFINFSRKADPKAMTPSKPKSGVLNYLLSGLIPLDNLERSVSVAALKKQGTSAWAASVVVALCMRTPETFYEPNSFGQFDREARDPDLLFVRKFVVEHAMKVFRDIQNMTDLLPEVKYARLLAVSDLFNRILMGRTVPLHSNTPRQQGESSKPSETEVARIMFEKNLISLLTSSLSEIDLNVPLAKRAVKYILRPLKTLTQTAVVFSHNSDISTSPGQTTDDDDISTATSLSDISDDREETPDLFRHSALAMLEPGREEDDSGSESGDEDAEMYDEGDYDDGMDYDEELDQADDDEAVSDPDDEDMGSDGDMENIPGDMPLNMEVVIDEDDDMSPDEDEDDDDEDEDDEEDDEEEDDDDDDDMDDPEIELLDEIEAADGASLDDDNEDDWEDELDESGEPLDGHHGGGADDMAEVEAIAEEFAEQLGRAGAFAEGEGASITIGGGFRSLEADVENGTYMNDLRLIRDEDEDEDDFPEDDEGEDIDDDEGEGDFMFEMHGDDEDEPFDMMDEAFGFLGGARPTQQIMHPRFGRPDMIVTPDGRTNMFRTVRTHNRAGNERHGADDGVNPLLQRNSNEPAAQHRSTRHRHFEMLTSNGGLDFLRLMRGGADAGPGPVLHDMYHAAVSSGGLMGGQMLASVRPEELDMLFGTHRARPDWAPREHRHQQDDVSQPPAFTPTSTVARWQEAARVLFGSGHVEKVNKIINSILKLLVPQAMKELRRQQEEEARAAEERRKEEEKQRKEEEERRAKEEEERQAREREEQQRRDEEEAARQAAEAEAATEEQSADAMEGVETQERDDDADHEAAAPEAGPSQEQPRVMTNIRGRQVDITELGIDQEYLDALPEELREEVIMQAVAERRSQQPQNTAAVEAPNNLDPAFLDALPEDVREEIIEQERQQQRRRDRQEQRRREQQAAGAPAGAEEMDIASVLASMDPNLRRQVLLEQALSNEVMEQLPEDLQQEARELLQQTEARHGEMGRRFGIPDALGGRALPGQNLDDPRRRLQRRQVVQMLDRSGIAAVLRLLFVPQQGSLKDSLTSILQNLAQNRQSRGELISLLLTILQDGSSDSAAVERSYATLTMRSKQPSGQQHTPRPLKRSTTGSLTAPLSQEMTPIMVIQQCLSALVGLVQSNGHAQTFFLNPHETPNTLKNKGKQKGKGKDSLAQKYALNALLSLLDRKMIMDNAACMEQLSTLLIKVTQPLNLLRRQEQASEPQDQSEQQAPAGESGAQPPVEAAEDGEQPSAQAGGSATADVGQSSDKKEEKKAEEEPKKPKTPSPPVIPEQNLQLVINILTAKECNSKAFRDTLATINNLSAIPGTKDIFGRELVRQAQSLGEVVARDLSELLSQLSKETSSTVQSSALSKFSPASSDQGKLLRVLMALDYLFASKSSDRSQQATNQESDARNPLLDSLYESPTFSPAWSRLSDCLKAIQDKDNMMNVATILSPLIEALMVVCKDMTLQEKGPLLSKSQQFAISSPEPESSMDSMFFRFTEDHRKILNELVRNNPRLMSGTFSLLVKNPKVLEFDNKRNYFTRRMHTRDNESRRAQHHALSFTVRRDQIFVDSYQKLFFKKPEEVKYGKLNVKFSGEEGVDAGGVTREWFQALTRQFFNPDYALFVPVAADRTTFHPSKLSWVNTEHLHYFKFIGRIIGKALYENRPLDCHFSRAVYKRILNKQVSIKDMETLDLEHYRSLVWTLENDITDVLTESFSVEHEAFGETQIVDLVPDGRNIAVTDENKHEWVQKLVEYKLTGSVNDQLEAFLQGFHEIVPSSLVSIFNEQELELLISGLPEIDIEDWKANTDYQNYSATSAQIQWFWRAVRSFDKEERAKLLQFVTGTSKVPLNGFKELEGMNGFSKFNIHRDYGDKDRLPSSHTCFNQLDLPEYDDYETLRSRLHTALTAGGEYFGFA